MQDHCFQSSCAGLTRIKTMVPTGLESYVAQLVSATAETTLAVMVVTYIPHRYASSGAITVTETKIRSVSIVRPICTERCGTCRAFGKSCQIDLIVLRISERLLQVFYYDTDKTRC
jgi:hypothetical protein